MPLASLSTVLAGPTHTEHLRSGGATTLLFVVDGAARGERGHAANEADVRVQVFTGIDLAYPDRLEGGVVNSTGLLTPAAPHRVNSRAAQGHRCKASPRNRSPVTVRNRNIRCVRGHKDDEACRKAGCNNALLVVALAANGDNVAVRELVRSLLAGALRHRIPGNTCP